MDAKQLMEQGTNLFGKRLRLLNFWQEAADNFYPERADFTFRRTIGDNFADNLMTSYPILCRRDLGDQFSTMLRPTAKEWFHLSVVDDSIEGNEERRWLQWATGTQRRAMYDRKTQFTRATKEGDHDFAAFGQTVISVTLNRNADAFLYRCWHLRDVAWQENADGKICAVFRKWKPGARDLMTLFPGKVDAKVTEAASRDPFSEVHCMHMVCEMEMYTGDFDAYDKDPFGNQVQVRRGATSTQRKRFPYVSVYYDVTNDKVIEARAVHSLEYVIPRWQTVSGSQYAYSPATIAALPEGRLLQAMTYTLLEAGEKYTNPPLIATEDAIRSDVAMYAGGITWVDMEYDEKLGEALRPIAQNSRGMPLGFDMQRDSRAMLAQAFFLNKLNLPQRAAEMTAYEVGQRIQEYIRGALPIFEPMENDYNGGICEATFELGKRSGLFGPPDAMPKRLRGAEVNFRFESPLHDAIEAQKGQKFAEMGQLIAQAIALDPSAGAIADVKVALRDALNGVGVPAKWNRSEAEVQEMVDAEAAQQRQQALLGTLQQGADVAATLGGARKDMAETAVAA